MKDVILTIITLIIPMILKALSSILTNEQFVKYGDKILDICERWIEKEPDWYDAYLIELIGVIREAAKIPDLPDAEEV